ncbi:MAG: CRISPR-associated protein Cas5 [Micrococcales bacterium]|nr:CRISPR-associated protein Cas5 [Micrococcales bacterium]
MSAKSLLLRLAGPAQSWAGVNLFGANLVTSDVPTRSGLLGLLACCLGVRRGQDWPAWLADTRLWVRIDRVGGVETDYQIVAPPPDGHMVYVDRQFILDRAGKLPAAGSQRSACGSSLRGVTSDGTPVPGAFTIMRKGFLSDAEYIIAIEHDTHLDDIAAATASPAFCHFLGRKQYPTTFPFVLGVSTESALDVLGVMPVDAPKGRLGTPGVAREVYAITGDRNYPLATKDNPATDLAASTTEEVRAWQKIRLSR